jgi:hypothetical protein
LLAPHQAGAQVVAPPILAPLAAKPAFKRKGRRVALSWDGKEWLFDPDWLAGDAGGSAKIALPTPHRLDIRGRFAGTNVSARFTIEVVQAGTVWQLRWNYEGQAPQSISLASWFARSTYVPIARLKFVGSSAEALSLTGAAIAARLTWPFSLSTSPGEVKGLGFSLGESAGTATRFAIEAIDDSDAASASPDNDVATFLGKPATRKLTASVSGGALVQPKAGWMFTSAWNRQLRLIPALPSLKVERFLMGGALVSVRRLADDGETRMSIGVPETPRNVFLERVTLFQLAGSRRIGFRGRISNKPKMIGGMRFAAHICGGDMMSSDKVHESTTLWFPVQLLSLHPRGEDEARYDVDFRRRRSAGVGLDRSAIQWLSDDVDGKEATLTIGRRPADFGALDIDSIHLGEESGVSLRLFSPENPELERDGPVLRTRRHQDGIDVGFQFHDYRLLVQNTGTTLVPGVGARRGVRFHAQHFQEEVFEAPPDGYIQSWGRYIQGGIDWALGKPPPKLRVLGDTAPYAGPGTATRLARTQVSGPSYVSFETQSAAPTLPLSVEALTDWSALTLAVPDRITAANLPLREQLGSLGIDETTQREEALRRVRNSLTKPANGQTSLELVTGMSFSPDARARFRTTGLPGSGSIPLWTAQLELTPMVKNGLAQPQSVVRATWVDGFNPNALIGGCGPVGTLGKDAPFETAIKATEAAEVFLMSSALGIPALRAVTTTGEDIPQSLVRMPRPQPGTSDWEFLDKSKVANPVDPKQPAIRQEGVMMPAPFSRFEARLTGFGADIDVEWQGEPAAPVPNDPAFRRAFSVERFIYRTSRGNLVFVKVMLKGFLFPYGFRVALIEVTDREAYSMKGFGAMMPGIKRQFILPKPVEKSFPGLYQPFAGLQIPVRHAHLVSGLSPELEPSFDPPAELVLPPDPVPSAPASPAPKCPPETVERKPVGKIFWPLAKGAKTDVQFAIEADETGVQRTLPMLFLDNAAVHHPPTVAAVLDYYNNSVEESRRTERHHGGKTIYAAPRKFGDTSFDTDSIVLKAVPRALPEAPAAATPTPTPTATQDNQYAQYQMDAFMEGADEPPFYPAMTEARIQIPALDRMMGAAQGLKRVGYVENYVRHGFGEGANPGELYLGFLDTTGLMNAPNQNTGGVAQTPTPLSAISRVNAIVGAPLRAASPENVKASPLRVATAPAPAPAPAGTDLAWDYSAIDANRFEPAKTFKLGKLFGIIDLGEAAAILLAAAQPKFREVYDYALGPLADIKDVLGASCSAASQGILDALNTAEAKLIAFLKSEKIGIPTGGSGEKTPALHAYYPALVDSLKAIAADLDALSGLLKASEPNIAAISPIANSVTEHWRSVRAAVEAVVANPAPEPVRNILAQVQTVIETVRDGVGAVLAGAMKQAIDDLRKQVIEPWIKTALDTCFNTDGSLRDAGVFDTIFGKLRPKEQEPAVPFTRHEAELLVADLLDNPAKIPTELQTAIIGRTLIVPVLEMIAAATGMATAIETLEAEAIAKAAELARAIVVRVLDALAATDSLVETAAAAASAACQGAARPLVDVAELALAGLPSADEFRHSIAVINDRLEALDLAGAPATPEVTATREAAASLRTSITRFGAQVTRLQDMRDAVTAAELACTAPGRVPAAIAELNRGCGSILKAVGDCETQAREVFDALSSLAGASDKIVQQLAKEAQQALGEALREQLILAYRLTLARLADTAGGKMSQLETRLKSSSQIVVARLQPFIDRLVTQATPVNAAYAQISTGTCKPEELSAMVASAEALLEVERDVFARALDYSVLQGPLLDQLKPLRDTLSGKVLFPLIDVHRKGLEAADSVLKTMASAPDLVVVLTGSIRTRLELARAAISDDLDALKKVPGNPASAASIVSRWSTGNGGFIVTTRTLVEMFSAITRGQMGAIFDFAAAKEAIEQIVRQLVPTRVTLTYAWTTKLHDIPAGNPIFLPGKDACKGIAEPEDAWDSIQSMLDDPDDQDSGPDDQDFDLAIATRIEVDLTNPRDRKVIVRGEVKPFAIALLGSLDLVRIGFRQTRFESVDGSAPSFSTKIDDVEIGKDLKFLDALAKYLGAKGQGPYVRPSFSPPGAMVGYAFNVKAVTFGGLTITNLGIELSMLLPFDGSQAVARFAISSRENPFGITIAPCYYGGGFLALYANARGVIAFEIQLEFGAATEFNFGPLNGSGRVTAGIYLFAKADGSRRLEGFVHAIGEGQIACFGISVCLEVKIIEQDSQMSGSATFTFSFRVGFVEISYGVDAQYSFSGGAGAKARIESTNLLGEPPEIDFPDKMTDWLDYRDNFVASWPS